MFDRPPSSSDSRDETEAAIPFKVFESSKSGRLLVEDSRTGFNSRVSVPKPKPGETTTVAVAQEEIKIKGIRENVFEIVSSQGTTELDFSTRRVPINTMD